MFHYLNPQEVVHINSCLARGSTILDRGWLFPPETIYDHPHYSAKRAAYLKKIIAQTSPKSFITITKYQQISWATSRKFLRIIRQEKAGTLLLSASPICVYLNLTLSQEFFKVHAAEFIELAVIEVSIAALSHELLVAALFGNAASCMTRI